MARAPRNRFVVAPVGGDENEEWLDEAEDLFDAVGISMSSAEEVTFVAVDSQSEVVGAVTYGWKHSDMGPQHTFSVAVSPKYRREGIARALVQEVTEHGREVSEALGVHPEWMVWVVNPHMAALLESMGFDTEGSEWTEDSPHMTRSYNNPRKRARVRANGSRTQERKPKTYGALQKDLRQLGSGVLGLFFTGGTLKSCVSTSPQVQMALLEMGHIVGDRGRGREGHFDLSVLTSDAGWIHVDPTFMQFQCKYSSDAESGAKYQADLDMLFRYFQEGARDPLMVFEVAPLEQRVMPGLVRYEPPNKLWQDLYGPTWLDFFGKSAHRFHEVDTGQSKRWMRTSPYARAFQQWRENFVVPVRAPNAKRNGSRTGRRGGSRLNSDLTSLRPNDLVKVYHGTRELFLPKLINGFDANQVVKRDYQPSGYRHAGMFVSPNFEVARRFGSRVVLEIEVPAKFLHGTDYSGRIRRKRGEEWNWEQEKDKKNYPRSFRPGLSATLLQSVEPQAILRGLVSPSQIKRVFYHDRWYTRAEFLRGGFEVYKPHRQNVRIEDAGYDLSNPRYTLDEFFSVIAALTGQDEESIRDSLFMLANLPEERRSRALDSLYHNLHFGETAAQSFEKKLLRAART